MTSARYLPQGPGDLVPGRGVEVVDAFNAHGRNPLNVSLANGAELRVEFNGSGRDIGEEWEHVYLDELNSSPAETHFIMTSDIVRVVDPINGSTLYERDAA